MTILATNGYNPRQAQPRWQARWADEDVFATKNDDPRPKYYVLEMFPYPSGRIHMGHVRNYAHRRVVARFMRAKGNNVLYPKGWDAFGLPAENAAMHKQAIRATWTYQNIAAMRDQFKTMGLSLDWSQKSQPAILNITPSSSGCSSTCWPRASPIAASRRSTGIRSTRPCSPTSR